jgi:hypothetical protein
VVGSVVVVGCCCSLDSHRISITPSGAISYVVVPIFSENRSTIVVFVRDDIAFADTNWSCWVSFKLGSPPLEFSYGWSHLVIPPFEFVEEEDTDVFERSDNDAPVTLDVESDSDSSENIVDDNE